MDEKSAQNLAIDVVHGCNGLFHREVADDALVCGLGIAGSEVGVGNQRVDGLGEFLGIARLYDNACFSAYGYPTHAGAGNVTTHRGAAAVHGFGQSYAKGLGLGAGGEGEDVGSVEILAEPVVQQTSEELHAAGAGDGFQLLVDGALAADEDDAVALDESIGADERVESFVGVKTIVLPL